MTDVQHKPPVDFVLKILVVLKLQAAHTAVHAGHFGAVESGCLGITRENVLSDRVIREDGILGRDGDQG